MKTGIIFTLFIFLSFQLLSSPPDSISKKKYRGKAKLARMFKGEKWEERHEISKAFNEYMGNGEFQKAVDFLTDELAGLDSLEHNYKMKTAGYIHGLRGYALYFLEDYEAAMKDVNRAIEVLPKWSAGYYFRGLIHYDSFDFQAAAQDYTLAIKNKRKADINYHFARANVYWDLGEIENAATDYTKCIKLEPAWAYPYVRRGSARHALEDLPGAKADYEKAIALDPHLIVGYQVLGTFYLKQNDCDAAIEVVLNGLHHNPDSPLLHETAGSFYLEKGENSQAITHFVKCLEMYDDDSEDMTRLQALVGISVTYYLMGDKENSMKYFDLASQLQPVLNQGEEGLEEFSRYCLGFMEKELETLPRMAKEF
jgi:tetratricopeptide (TPR) repeat protein